MTRWLAALAALTTIAMAVSATAETATPPSTAQIEAAVAPVALYPDALLTPLLMAATYPTEVSEAAQWLDEAHNAKLRGDALAAALEPRPWDPSVKALAPFPAVVAMMAARPAWMDQLGQAFVAEPAAVAAAIQTLRHRAVATGMLKSSPRLTVSEAGVVLTIAPTDPAVVYIPTYNPVLVFGAWPYADNPPMFIEPPEGFRVSGADMETGIGFSVGYGVLPSLWGWAKPNWSNGTVAVDVGAYNRINRYGPHVAAAVWHHEAHSTGYFHITQAEITPAAPPAKHERATARTGGKHAEKMAARHPAHETRHAARHDHRKTKVAHARAPAHRGKVRVASSGRRSHHAR